MTSIGVSRRDNPSSTHRGRCWFDAVGGGDRRFELEQGDTGNGGIGRNELAEVLVRSLDRCVPDLYCT